jgi:hypothetical protein
MKFCDPDKSDYLALFYGADGSVVDTGRMTLEEAFRAARASGCSLAILHLDCLWDTHEKLGLILRRKSAAYKASRTGEDEQP